MDAKRAKELLEAATPGPWTVVEAQFEIRDAAGKLLYFEVADSLEDNTAFLIAAAPDLAETVVLLSEKIAERDAEILRLRSELDHARGRLESVEETARTQLAERDAEVEESRLSISSLREEIAWLRKVEKNLEERDVELGESRLVISSLRERMRLMHLVASQREDAVHRAEADAREVRMLLDAHDQRFAAARRQGRLEGAEAMHRLALGCARHTPSTAWLEDLPSPAHIIAELEERDAKGGSDVPGQR